MLRWPSLVVNQRLWNNNRYRSSIAGGGDGNWQNRGQRVQATISEERPDTPHAIQLIDELQTHLESFYPPESRHGFSVDRLIAEGVAFFVVRVDGEAAGCGGIKLHEDGYGELKRMYVRPQFRGSGLGKMILEQVANHATSHGITLLRLETGIHQKAAIRLYETWGFRRIPPFGPYTDDPMNLCFEKALASDD
jgi:putative acetyltransferase